MEKDNRFTKRELEVINELMQGKSNDEISTALTISSRTTEKHLHSIYKKLAVDSRARAILALRETDRGVATTSSVESTIGENKQRGYDATQAESQPKKRTLIFLFILLGIGLISIYAIFKWNAWTITKEAEVPDQKTIGQRISRSNASGQAVLAHFGSSDQAPWQARAGSVTYYVTVPKTEVVYLQLHYSKFGSPSASILIFIDDEQTPRNWFEPQDQKDWNRFTTSDWLVLDKVTAGRHAIKFQTSGQDFGVADLDYFVLTNRPAP